MILSDTSQEAAAFQVSLLRAKSVSERLALTMTLSQKTIALSKRAIRRANPEMSENDLRCRFVELHYGKEMAEHFRKYLQKHSA